jgi:hypothetical protein
MPEPIHTSAAVIDLSQRFGATTTVAASPAAGSETVIATLSTPALLGLTIVTGVILKGWAAFTVGTNGVSAQLRIYDTLLATGELIADSGATTWGVAATKLMTEDVMGLDPEADVGSYCLTLTIGSGSATSTVSAVFLSAIAV